MALSELDIELLGLFASLAVFSLIIGLAVQQTLGNIVNSFMLAVDRPFEVGDRIEVGTVSGDVVKVSPRSTTVNTNDNISMIIPNSDVINKQVINWSHNDRRIRFHIPVGVSYKEDPAQIKALLMEVAAGHKDVLKKPAPDVLFIRYGESSLDFDLLVWTNTYTYKQLTIPTKLQV